MIKHLEQKVWFNESGFARLWSEGTRNYLDLLFHSILISLSSWKPTVHVSWKPTVYISLKPTVHVSWKPTLHISWTQTVHFSWKPGNLPFISPRNLPFIYPGFRWYPGIQWYTMVSNGIQWYPMVFNGFQWYKWYPMISMVSNSFQSHWRFITW